MILHFIGIITRGEERAQLAVDEPLLGDRHLPHLERRDDLGRERRRRAHGHALLEHDVQKKIETDL